MDVRRQNYSINLANFIISLSPHHLQNISPLQAYRYYCIIWVSWTWFNFLWWFVLGQFLLLASCLKSWQSLQKWSKMTQNNHLSWLVKIWDTLFKIYCCDNALEPIVYIFCSFVLDLWQKIFLKKLNISVWTNNWPLRKSWFPTSLVCKERQINSVAGRQSLLTHPSQDFNNSDFSVSIQRPWPSLTHPTQTYQLTFHRYIHH